MLIAITEAKSCNGGLVTTRWCGANEPMKKMGHFGVVWLAFRAVPLFALPTAIGKPPGNATTRLSAFNSDGS